MEREIKKVSIYVRKSREEETDDALKRQQSVLKELCEKNDWQYDLYKEVGSSQDIDRPELQKMLNRIKLFEYDGVVVADLDRLSRSTIHFGQIKEMLISVGCLVITPNKVYDFTKQDDDLFSDLQSVLAKNEYQTIKRRLVRGVRQSAKDGNWLGKKSPIGYVYNRNTKRLQKSEDAPVIRRLFDEYLNGMSTKDIAHKFTIENVTTTVGMIWTPSGIARLLRNPVYKGDSLYGKTTTKNGKRSIKTSPEEQIIVENTHEGIITKEEWETVQKIKAERYSKPIALGANKRRFSGLIKCQLCDRTHSFQSARNKRMRINSCQTRIYSKEQDKYEMCKNGGMNVADFEKIFYRLFEREIDKIKEYRELITNSNQDKIEKDYKSDIVSLEKQIKKLTQDIKRVQQGFVAQIFTEQEAQEQIKNYNLQIKNSKTQIEELKVLENDSSIDFLDVIINKMEMFIQGKDTMEEKEANRILRELIDAIYYKKVNDHEDGVVKIDIHWKHDIEEDEHE